MTRDDFEEWLDDHTYEALAHIEGDRMPVKKWITLFGKALHHLNEGEPEEDTDDDDGEVDFDPFDE
jgi:hypothetical protein